ncbi:polyprenyl synthetase family protein [Kitasatospora terrestris]|uniref:Polyprenyl synthetase family protein n=1 Tax=Kitasatospora terrestris TaxID=258051 RepID=A0ABP9DB04_9ACTN
MSDHLDGWGKRAALADRTFAADVARRVDAFTRNGGKRMRSQFLWWAMRGCAPEWVPARAALTTAGALELLQTCALVHDDVMDRCDMRRGRRALHEAVTHQYAPLAGRARAAALGVSAGILAGDLALAWADDLAAAARCELPPLLREQVAGIWSDLRLEMVAGQYLDVRAEVTGEHTPGRALRIALLKSALYSVERPLHLGAVLAGAGPEQVRALRRAGRCAGVAFQLKDDVEGVFGDPKDTGKPCGDDIRAGKLTYLAAVARARAAAGGDTAALGVLRDSLGDSGLDEAGLARVRTAMETTGARAAVQERVEVLARRSIAHLRDARLDVEAGRRLGALLRATSGLAGDHRTTEECS